MKIYTFQPIVALVFVANILLCAADQQRKEHVIDNNEGGADEHNVYYQDMLDNPTRSVNIASDDVKSRLTDIDCHDDSCVLIERLLEELHDRNMDRKEEVGDNGYQNNNEITGANENEHQENNPKDNSISAMNEGSLFERGDYESDLEQVVERNEYTDDRTLTEGDPLNVMYETEDDYEPESLIQQNGFDNFEDNSMTIMYEGDDFGPESDRAVKQNGGSSPVLFKYVKEYQLIWNDKGSGADRDVSIWRPVDIESGFYPLGDTAHGRYGKPAIPSITVSEGVSGVLAAPSSYEHIWNDRGSGANSDVSIVKLIPPSGYTCLGYVAVRSYGQRPDLSKYRCVKSEYVTTTEGLYDFIWNDRGSGARRDVAVYSNTNIDSVDARMANTFTAVKFYHNFQGHPPLLRKSTSSEKTQATVVPNKDTKIIVYQVTLKKGIWNDAGSGANRDFSSWRAEIPEGYYSLGDYGVASHSGPHFVTLVRAVKDDALRPPLYFRERWNDRGSGANRDVTFYEPVCPSGYRALGHVSINAYNSQPDKRYIRCVKAEYTVQGQWRLIWNDKGSGANRDVSVYMAVPSGSGQGVRAMSTVPCYCGMDRTAYVLNSKYIQYIVSKPVKKYTLTDIHYQIDSRHILNSRPEILASTFFVNRGTTPQTSTRVLTYSYTESHTFSTTKSFEVGVQISYTTKVPMVAEKSISFSLSTTFATTSSDTVTETKQSQIRATVSVQPKSRKSAVATATRYVVDVPFTATLVEEYYDGTKSNPQRYNGKYKGIQVNDVHIEYNPDIPL